MTEEMQNDRRMAEHLGDLVTQINAQRALFQARAEYWMQEGRHEESQVCWQIHAKLSSASTSLQEDLSSYRSVVMKEEMQGDDRRSCHRSADGHDAR